MRPFIVFCSAAVLAVAWTPLSAFGQPAKPAEKELVAVLDFQATGATREQAIAVADVVRQRLLESGRFRLVEREMMDKILQEQAFQQTGCTSQECAAQVGKILGVRKMINGKLSKVGEKTWVLSGTMTDVETAETLRAATVTKEGEFITVLEDGTASLTVRLIGQKEGGLTDIMEAAGIKQKNPRSGFGLSISESRLSGKTTVQGGPSYSYTASGPGLALDYTWGIGSSYSLSFALKAVAAKSTDKSSNFFDNSSISAICASPPGCGGGTKPFFDSDWSTDSKVNFTMAIVEGRYWMAETWYAGLFGGYVSAVISEPHANDTNFFPLFSVVDKTLDGTTLGASLGWESRKGWFVGAEYSQINLATSGYKEDLSSLSILGGYRFK